MADTKLTRDAKACKKCGQVKPLEMFYKHPTMGDGRLSKCKVCTNADTKRYHAANGQYREREKERNKRRGKRQANKQSIARTVARRKEKYPEQFSARAKLTYAIKHGHIVRPDGCSKCGSDFHVHGHHEDYSRPLDVVWLCARCHVARHGEMRALGIKP